MKYKAQIVDGWVDLQSGSPRHPTEFEPLLQKALDDGVAKGWKLFSVSEAVPSMNNLGAINTTYWEGPKGSTGYQLSVTLIWEVPPPKPTTPQEVERERRREVERKRKRGGRTTAG